MFDRGCYQVFAFFCKFVSNAFYRPVIGLGAARSKIYLARLGAESICDLFSRRVKQLLCFSARGMNARRISEHGRKARDYFFGDIRIHLRGRRVININKHLFFASRYIFNISEILSNSTFLVYISTGDLFCQ